MSRFIASSSFGPSRPPVAKTPDSSARYIQQYQSGSRCRLLVNLIELVLAFRRADEDTPAIAVGQRRTNNLVPELCLDLCVLVEDGSIPVRAAQVVWMVGTDDVDAAALCA